jgi:hypothetical protein
MVITELKKFLWKKFGWMVVLMSYIMLILDY